MRGLVTTCAGLALVSSAVGQQTFTVNSFDDAVDANPGDGLALDALGNTTLRAAVMEANALAGNDVILLPAGTYELSLQGNADDQALTGDLDVAAAGSLTIEGAGAATTIIDGGGEFGLGDRIFNVLPGAALVLRDLTVTRGFNEVATPNGVLGGGISASESSLTLERCVVSDCEAKDDPTAGSCGGGIFAHGYAGPAMVTAIDTMITGNVAGGGGGFCGLYSGLVVSFSGCDLTNNAATHPSGSGGGLASRDVRLTVVDTTIAGNSAMRFGGGIYLLNGIPTEITIAQSEISNNTAGNSGGAIRIDSASALDLVATITETVISGNSGDAGGAIFNFGGDLTLVDCSVTGNATVQASAIQNAAVASLALTGCELTNNDSSTGAAIGGTGTFSIGNCTFVANSAVLSNSGTALMTDCTLQGHTTAGGLVGGAGALVMERCEVTGNSAATHSIINTASISAIRDCTFVGNVGPAGAGAIKQFNGQLELSGCTFTGNSGRDAGAVLFSFAAGSATVVDCTFEGNVQAGTVFTPGGGAITAYGGPVDVLQSIFCGNSSTNEGGAVFVGPSSTLDLYSSTITGNTCAGGAGGLRCNGSVGLFNSIVASNVGTTAPDGDGTGTFLSAGHNLIGDGTGMSLVPTAGDLIGTPALPIDPLLGPDKAPLPGSPALDAGGATGAAPTDIRGNPRIADGDGDTVAIIDIGAVEATPMPDLPPTAVAGPDQSIHAGEIVLLDGSGSFDDNTATANLVYAWSFIETPAGSTATLMGDDTATPSFVADLAGSYSIQLVVTDEAAQSSLPDEVVISSTNLAPTADAGMDLGAVEGFVVVLDGSGSSDPEMDPLVYSWSFQTTPAGSLAVLAGADTAVPSFVPDVVGVYVARLEVNDGFLDSAPDEVEISVISGEEHAGNLLVEAQTIVNGLPIASVTTQGNQQALSNFISQAIQRVQSGNIPGAIDKIQKAIDRTDGCPTNGVPDGNGPGRDWITDCAVQQQVYDLLIEALSAVGAGT